MADFWFVSAPLPGHLDWGGLSRTAQALAQAGHRVSWLSGAQVAGAVTRAGLDFVPLQQTGWLWPPPPLPDVTQLPPQEAVMLRYRRALDTWLSVDRVGDAAAELISLGRTAGAPDMVVTDPFISASALAAEALDLPLVVGGWPALAELDEDRLLGVQKTLGADSRARLRRLLERFNLQGRNFSRGATPSVRSPLLHLCFFTEDWYAEERGGLLPQNAYLGGAPSAPDDDPPDWLNAIPADAPLALITLGTAFTGDLGFFSWAAQAAARLDLIPIVVIGWQPARAGKARRNCWPPCRDARACSTGSISTTSCRARAWPSTTAAWAPRTPSSCRACRSWSCPTPPTSAPRRGASPRRRSACISARMTCATARSSAARAPCSTTTRCSDARANWPRKWRPAAGRNGPRAC